MREREKCARFIEFIKLQQIPFYLYFILIKDFQTMEITLKQ